MRQYLSSYGSSVCSKKTPLQQKKDRGRSSTLKKSIYEVNNASINSSPNFQLSPQLSFKGKYEAANKALSRAAKYDGWQEIITDIDKHFNGRASKLKNFITGSNYTERFSINSANEVIFQDKSVIQKVIEGATYPFKRMFLDIANSLTQKSKKNSIIGKSGIFRRMYNSNILGNHRKQTAASEAFHTLNGMFSEYTSKNGAKAPIQNIVDVITSGLKQDRGNFNTKSERALNRLATGLVSASFIGRDFYNISRLQHDDDKMARKTSSRRRRQEVTRIGLMAFLSFISLGAFSKASNNNKYLATFIIASTALVSEIFSRVVNGTSLFPLSPEGARLHKSKLLAEGRITPAEEKFQIFGTEKKQKVNNINGFINSVSNAGKANFSFDISSFKGDLGTSTPLSENDKKYRQEKENVKKGVNIALKAAAVIATASVIYTVISNYNKKLTGFNKETIEKFQNIYDKIMTKKSLVKKDEMDNVIKAFEATGNTALSKEYKKLLEIASSEGDIVTLDKMGRQCYAFDKIDNAFATPIRFITYPVKFLWSILNLPAKGVQRLLNKISPKAQEVASAGASTIDSKEAMARLRSVHKIFAGTINHNEVPTPQNTRLFEKQLTKSINYLFNNEGSSKQSNKDLAAFSRVFVTGITSYFFINDYRNQVLIESDGRDTEKAKEVTKERVMQKVANLITNSMFMTLFMKIFNVPYNSGLVGATSVAVATEFTNETVVRKIIGTPTKKMTKAELEKYDADNYYSDSVYGKWCRTTSTLMGKKPLTEKAKSS